MLLFPQTSDLKPTKHIARLSRPEILQDLATLRRLCAQNESAQDTCIRVASGLPRGAATASKAPSPEVLTSPSPTDVSVFSFSAFTDSAALCAGSGSTADAGKERPGQGAREAKGASGAWGVGMGTGRGGRAIKTPKRFLDHVSVQDSRKRIQPV